MKIKDIIYEQILNEVNPNDVVFSHAGRAIVDTDHATERYTQRLKLPKNYFDTFFTRMIDRIVKIDNNMNANKRDIPEECLVYSKEYNQAIVVAYRYDRFDRQDNDKHFYIMTYLPPGVKASRTEELKRKTFPVLIEHEQSWLDDNTNAFKVYLSGIVANRRVKLNEDTAQYAYQSVSLVNGLDHKIILCENKLYDVSIPVIEID